jgi:hypothetical protein
MYPACLSLSCRQQLHSGEAALQTVHDSTSKWIRYAQIHLTPGQWCACLPGALSWIAEMHELLQTSR